MVSGPMRWAPRPPTADHPPSAAGPTTGPPLPSRPAGGTPQGRRGPPLRGSDGRAEHGLRGAPTGPRLRPGRRDPRETTRAVSEAGEVGVPPVVSVFASHEEASGGGEGRQGGAAQGEGREVLQIVEARAVEVPGGGAPPRREGEAWGSRSPRGGDALRGGRTRDEETRTSGPEQVRDDDSIAKMKAAEEALEAKKKEEPSFELSGKLAAETNRYRGVTLLFTEPPDARKPDVRWRLYVFKGGEVLNEPLYVHRQSCYLFGRERRVADIPTDHPSCSKQHAVIQFRFVEKEQPDGLMSKKQVRPYLMDLGSTNGTFINDNRLEPQRYYELMEKDTIKFGNSSREYVLLHENSA